MSKQLSGRRKQPQKQVWAHVRHQRVDIADYGLGVQPEGLGQQHCRMPPEIRSLAGMSPKGDEMHSAESLRRIPGKIMALAGRCLSAHTAPQKTLRL